MVILGEISHFFVSDHFHLLAVSCWAFWGWHPPADASVQAAVDNTTPTAANVQHELQRCGQAINHLGPCIHVWFEIYMNLHSFRQWTHSKHTLPSPKNTLLPCWKNIHGRWRHECFHRSWPAKTTGLVGHMDDLLILQPTGHWYSQLVFALFLGIWWSFCRTRALWPFKYPSIIQYTRWASRKDTFFYMFEVILDAWVGTWKKCLYRGYGVYAPILDPGHFAQLVISYGMLPAYSLRHGLVKEYIRLRTKMSY